MRQLTSQSGQISYAKSYDPYGTVTQTSGAGQSAFGYTGEQQDASGMTYLRARYYNTADRRFMSRDTWGGIPFFPITFNKWAYSHDNPIRFTDPSGHDPWWCEGSINPADCYMTWISGHVNNAFSETDSIICAPFPSAEFLGEDWRISHYNYAMENDPAFPTINQDTGEPDYVNVGGLNDGRRFRRQFIYNIIKGIPRQGTGLAEDGHTYITIDYTTTGNSYPNNTNWLNTTDPTTWFFIYGKGGYFKEGKPWATVAVSAAELSRPGGLREGDKIKIDIYPQVFEVTDTGSFEDTKHVDIFIGPTTLAKALQWGLKDNVKVWRIGN